MAGCPMNPGDSSFSSEETCRMEEPVVSREPAQADVVVQPNTACAECKNEVKSPHLLCCLHSVCEECLPGMAVEGQQRIKCGECGDTSTHCSNSSSSKGVENLCEANNVPCFPISNGPLSRYVEGVKIVGKASSQESFPCGNKRCKTPNSPSIVYCTDCSIFMCDRCSLGHEIAAPFEDHTVKTLKEIGAFNLIDCQQMFAKSPPTNTCSRHRGDVLKYCCEQCSLLMCQACTVDRTSSHAPVFLSEGFVKLHRQSLSTARQASICFGMKCESMEEQLQTELRSVEQTTEASVAGLNAAFQSIHEAVERRKEELHRQIINAAEEKKRAIGSRLRSAEKRKKTAGSTVSTLEFLLKNGNAHDLLSSKDLILTYQSVLTSKWSDDDLEATESSVLNFKGTNQASVLKSIEEFGIVTDGACPKKCRVEPKPDQLQLIGLDAVTFTVVAFDSKGIACRRGGDKISSFLHPKPPTPGPAIKARVVDNDNGTYSVSFPSVYPGPCLLSIEVNGIGITESSFDVTLHYPSQPELPRKIECITSSKEYLQFALRPGKLHGVAVSSTGTVFISDPSSRKIHVFSKERKHIMSFGIFETSASRVNCPNGLAVGNRLVYAACCGAHCVQVFTENGQFVQQITNFFFPWNVTVHNQQLYVADSCNHRVSVYTLQGQHVRTIGSGGNGPGQFNLPSGVAFSPDGDMYVSDWNNHRVQVFNANGQYKMEFGQGQLKYPRDIVITSDGDVLVADEGNNRVVAFSTNGNTCNLIHSFEANTPYGLAIDNDGNILVTDYERNRVTIF